MAVTAVAKSYRLPGLSYQTLSGSRCLACFSFKQESTSTHVTDYGRGHTNYGIQIIVISCPYRGCYSSSQIISLAWFVLPNIIRFWVLDLLFFQTRVNFDSVTDYGQGHTNNDIQIIVEILKMTTRFFVFCLFVCLVVFDLSIQIIKIICLRNSKMSMKFHQV